MRIAIDAHMVGERETGNERYTVNLLDGLARIPREDDRYLVLTPRPEAVREAVRLPSDFELIRVRPATSALRIPVGMPLAVRRARCDLLHVSYIAPPLPLCATVVTVHDLSYLAHPEWLSARVRLLLSLLVPQSVRRAARVIAISEFTRRDLVNRYRLDPEKIAVVGEAPADSFRRLPDDASRPLPEGVREPYVLAVGNLEPRKNLLRLMEAYARLIASNDPGGRLVIAGKAKYQGAAITGVVSSLGLQGRVSFTGFVDDETLRLLYSRAAVFVYPSLYEGFGLPPLEAMACGCPVVASNLTAIPETVGDAALLVDPTSVDSLAQGMASLLHDPGLRERLSAAGIAHARRYSWTATAERTRLVYRDALRTRAFAG